MSTTAERIDTFLESLTEVRRNVYPQGQRWRLRSYWRIPNGHLRLRVDIECGYDNDWGHLRIELMDLAPLGAKEWTLLYDSPIEGSPVEGVSYVQKLDQVEDALHDAETMLLTAAAAIL